MRIFDAPSARNQTYNLGNPDAITSIADLAQLVIAIVGTEKTMSPQFRELAPGAPREVPDIWAHIGRLEKDLNFQPRIGLREGLERIQNGLAKAK